MLSDEEVLGLSVDELHEYLDPAEVPYVLVLNMEVSFSSQMRQLLVYRTYFTREFPARAFVGAGSLLNDARFEVFGIAVRR